jgi:hypothetical protein
MVPSRLKIFLKIHIFFKKFEYHLIFYLLNLNKNNYHIILMTFDKILNNIKIISNLKYNTIHKSKNIFVFKLQLLVGIL